MCVQEPDRTLRSSADLPEAWRSRQFSLRFIRGFRQTLQGSEDFTLAASAITASPSYRSRTADLRISRIYPCHLRRRIFTLATPDSGSQTGIPDIQETNRQFARHHWHIIIFIASFLRSTRLSSTQIARQFESLKFESPTLSFIYANPVVFRRKFPNSFYY